MKNADKQNKCDDEESRAVKGRQTELRRGTVPFASPKSTLSPIISCCLHDKATCCVACHVTHGAKRAASLMTSLCLTERTAAAGARSRVH